MQLKSVFLFFAIFLVVGTKAQDKQKIESLDDYFGGIPLKSGFAKWVEYLYRHPYMGLDSADYLGSYSSFKPGIQSHFPFPDSVLVKIRAGNQLVALYGAKDTTVSHDLLIEGIFGSGKEAEKAANKCYNQLHKLFKKHYRYWTDFYKNRVFYQNGKNTAFPNFMMMVDFSKKNNFYFVMLVYEPAS